MDRTPRELVHLELHTPNLGSACAFYSNLLAWRPERIGAAGAPYQALELGGEVGGGVVECGTARALWLPYVEVPSVSAATERARHLGASVLLAPREGPAGWRSVITACGCGEIALWQPKRGSAGSSGSDARHEERWICASPRITFSNGRLRSPRTRDPRSNK
jgi:predicted enzyme related to lactoylglutathione lyase